MAAEVSVMVLTYQQASYIEAALDSLWRQTIPVQVVVCDDGSTDGTAQIAERLMNERGWPNGSVLIKHEHNLGVATSYRDAFDKSEADIVMVNDGDDISLPHRAEVLLNTFRQSRALLIGSNVIPISAAGEHLDPTTFFWRVHDEGEVDIEKVDPYARWCVLGACMAFRKSVWLEFGPLPEQVIMCDKAMTHRALAFGRILLIKEPLLMYRSHNQGLTSWLTYWSVDRTIVKRKLLQFAKSNSGLLADLDVAVAKCDSSRVRQRLHSIQQSLLVQTRLANAVLGFPTLAAIRIFIQYLFAPDRFIRKEAAKNLMLAIDPARHEMWARADLHEMKSRLRKKISRFLAR